ncbi:MAG: gamma carbonic anhydrase family protein [Candidatus Cloacimonadota bacterium]|nr:MAG: gamma carbonic anhydrase family protein [Candidatus Cloacimonadota bacterium]
MTFKKLKFNSIFGGVYPYLKTVPKLEEGVFVAPGARIIGDVCIGANVGVWYNTVIRGDVNSIAIGSGTNIQDNSLLHVETDICPLKIGSDVTIGHQVILHGCTIGDRCLIGMGAIVMNDAVIGNDCIIGAGALITEKTIIPEGSVVIGRPGKVIRQLTDVEKKGLKTSAKKYVNFAKNHIKSLQGDSL